MRTPKEYADNLKKRIITTSMLESALYSVNRKDDFMTNTTYQTQEELKVNIIERKYDADGREIYAKDADGRERIREFDSKGHPVYFKDFDGFETHWKYNKDGNEVYFGNSAGYERWTEYNRQGLKSCSKDSNGIETKWDYKGDLISHKVGGFEWRWDDKGNEVYFKKPDAQNEGQFYERWQEFDDRGNLMHIKDNRGREKWAKYDAEGHQVFL